MFGPEATLAEDARVDNVPTLPKRRWGPEVGAFDRVTKEAQMRSCETTE